MGNTATLAVLGAGFGRTGTLSLKRALETLGFAPCYHMVEVLKKPEQARAWKAAARGEHTDWHALLAPYRAAVDWPATAFWRELLCVFPNARVILTVRDSAEWYASFHETIIERMSGLAPPRESPLRAVYDLTHELILDGVFAGCAADEAQARKVYDAHNRTVSQSVEPRQLLVFDPASGWEPLCAFLDRPVPRERFPHVNTRAGFLRDYLGSTARRRITPS